MEKRYQWLGISHEEAERMANEVYASILDWFETMGMGEVRDDMERWFDAAVADRYCWTDGPPGNCLWLYDQVLVLIREAHTLWRLGEYEGETDLTGAAMARPGGKAYFRYPAEVPRLLSVEECANPMRVVEECFSFKSYEEWTDDLHAWLDAALSNGSVTEHMDGSAIMPFCRHLRRLVEACYVLGMQKGKGRQTPAKGISDVDDAYSEIVVTGQCKIKLAMGDQQRVERLGDTLYGEVLYEVENGVMTITNIGEDFCPELFICYRALDDLLVKDLSEVEMIGLHEGPHLRIIAMGEARISGEVAVEHLEVFAVNSGRITLSGKAAIAQVSSRDEGECRLPGLTAATVKATIRDSARAEIQVSHVLDYTKSEKGKLSYPGEPVVRVRDAVSGNWVCIFDPAGSHLR